MREVPFLKTLEQHGVPVTDDTRTRMELFLDNIRRKSGAQERLQEYAKQQSGGADEDVIPIEVKPSSNDFLGPQLQWFVEVMGTPYAQVVVRMLFTVLFFVSYLEKLPVLGGILSAVLDLTITGGRVMIKTIQKALPPMIGLIPLPFMSIVGMVAAAVFGMFLWPVIAIVSFSRQEFVTAIEAMMRIIPPPMGDMIADGFLDVNRTAAKLNENRKKITDDIVTGLRSIMDLGTSATDRVASGANTLIEKLPAIAEKPPAPVPTKGGKRRRRTKRQKKFSRKH